jgi:hypothetical protein
VSPTRRNPIFLRTSNVTGKVAGALREGVISEFEDSEAISAAGCVVGSVGFFSRAFLLLRERNLRLIVRCPVHVWA